MVEDEEGKGADEENEGVPVPAMKVPGARARKRSVTAAMRPRKKARTWE